MITSRVRIVLALAGLAVVFACCSSASGQQAYYNQWWRMIQYGYYDPYYSSWYNPLYYYGYGTIGTGTGAAQGQEPQTSISTSIGFTKAWGGGACSTGASGFTPAFKVHSAGGVTEDTGQSNPYDNLVIATVGMTTLTPTTTPTTTTPAATPAVPVGGSPWRPGGGTTTVTRGTTGVGLAPPQASPAAAAPAAVTKGKPPAAQPASLADNPGGEPVRKKTGSGVIVYKASGKQGSGGSSSTGHSRFMDTYRKGESTATPTPTPKKKASFFTKAISPTQAARKKREQAASASGSKRATRTIRTSSVRTARQTGRVRMVRPNVSGGIPAGARDFRSARRR